jgi:hypothetical protein
MVWSVSPLGTPVDTLLDTVAELHRHGVKEVIHDRADASGAVATAGLLAAADGDRFGRRLAAFASDAACYVWADREGQGRFDAPCRLVARRTRPFYTDQAVQQRDCRG